MPNPQAESSFGSVWAALEPQPQSTELSWQYRWHRIVFRDRRTPTRHKTQLHTGSLYTKKSLMIKSILLFKNKLEKTNWSGCCWTNGCVCFCVYCTRANVGNLWQVTFYEEVYLQLTLMNFIILISKCKSKHKGSLTHDLACLISTLFNTT